MKQLLKRLPSSVQFILLTYGSGVIVFTFFRILLLCIHFEEATVIPEAVMLRSLVMGLRFDAVINGYLLVLPAFILGVMSFARAGERKAVSVISVFIIIVYALAFFIHVFDVRWFGHGSTRLTVSALQWADTPGWMLRFVFQDIYNYPLLLLFIVLIWFYSRLIRRIRDFAYHQPQAEINLYMSIAVHLLLFILIFVSIRGRLAIKSPIRWGTAFFSEYNFANQLGLNPVFTLMRSWLDQQESKAQRFEFMADSDAEKILGENFQTETDTLISPVARKVIAEGLPHQYNVVLVLMESMSAKNMSHFGNDGHLTPVLDSIYDRSAAFPHFYSDGNHTFNGIYSSLYGYHSLPMVHHMKDLTHQQPYTGLPGTLSACGYQTVFFTTHDDQFDNMAGFLLPNGFQKIISERDYDKKYVLSTLGVPDHIMFDKVISELENMHKADKPFFAAMITGSNHEPFVLPDDISLKTHAGSLDKKMVEYADWSVGTLLDKASKQPWFDSTIFIFTGDHGGLIEGFDRYLAFHHIPLIIYAPEIFPEAKVFSAVGGQADIYATVCGLLNISYTNNSMGVDLMTSTRKYYPFNFDEELCCISSNTFFTMGHEKENCFSISGDRKQMTKMEKTAQTDSMKLFLEAAMQTTQRMIDNHKMK